MISPFWVMRLLSQSLRHEPATFGITLDAAGWTDVAALLAAFAARSTPVTADELAAIVSAPEIPTFALSPDGTRIRAEHRSEPVVEAHVMQPPAVLYHGTTQRHLSGIRAIGLTPRGRAYVALTTDRELAKKIASRRGRPLILEVRAADLAATGHELRCTPDGIWLTTHVPPAFIEPSKRRMSLIIQEGFRGIAREALATCSRGNYMNDLHEMVELTGVERAMRETGAFDLATVERLPSRSIREDIHPTAVTVTDETALEAIRRLGVAGTAGHLGCLSFSWGILPGGGALDGHLTQEASLARGSALAPCLQTQAARYPIDDLAIYAPQVPVFRDDEGAWFDAPVACSMISCAAPNARSMHYIGMFDETLVEASLRRRAELVLKIADATGIDTLILGAWGCGWLRNDPHLVAYVFHNLLTTTFANRFRQIVFAIPEPGMSQHVAFATAFPPAE